MRETGFRVATRVAALLFAVEAETRSREVEGLMLGLDAGRRPIFPELEPRYDTPLGPESRLFYSFCSTDIYKKINIDYLKSLAKP